MKHVLPDRRVKKEISMKKRLVGMIVLFVLLTGALSSQQVSEKKDVAVFALSYYDWTIPPAALGMVDAQIKDVFVNLGRFNILGMTYRLSSGDINAFIEEVKKVKEQNMEVPEAVRLGMETFTEEDFNKIVGSFLVVIPVVSFYNLAIENNQYRADIETSFTILNVDELKTIASFTVKSIGYDADPNLAVKEAVEDIPIQLTYELRSVPEFVLKTGIIEVSGNYVTMELGTNMGVKVGDEYSIVTTRVLSTGHEKTEEGGLILVKEVGDEVSTGYVLFSGRKPAVGDQLKEIPRLGFETSPYVHIIANIADSSEGDPTFVTAGFRQIFTRGFYGYNPVVGVEIPINIIGDFGGLFNAWLPLNVYAGAQLNWYLKRIQVSPLAGIGIGMYIPLNSEGGTDEFGNPQTYDYFVSHFGGLAQVNLSYLVTRNVKLFAEAGFAYWLSFRDNFWYSIPSYGGLFGGAGVSIKY